MKKFFKFYIVILFFLIIVISYKLYLNQKEDLSKDDNFQTWIDINKKSFFDNEPINIQLHMKHIGESEKIDVYLSKFPFSLLITGNNGFHSIIESPSMFGIQQYTFKKDETMTMDCSNYGFYHYFQAMNIFKGYEQPEPRNYPGSEFVLPPGEYKLKLTTFYEEDLSGETKHELISTEYIKVKAKNNWESMNESKITKNFKLEANLNKNIFEDDEFIRLWSSMIYCGEEDSIVFPYMTFYPLEIYIYNDKHEELELDYTIYFNLDEGKELTNTKPLYYAPLTRLKLPTGKYTAEFLFYYPNENGEIVNDTIEMDFEIVPKSIS